MGAGSFARLGERHRGDGGGRAAAVELLRGRTAAFTLGRTTLVLAFTGVPLALGVAALVSARVGSAVPAGRSSS